MSFELVAYDEIKALLGLEQAAITSYPALETIQTRLLDSIEEFLGRSLEKTERTETVFVNSTQTQMISLTGLPITEIASVVVTTEGDSETFGSSDYFETEYGIKLYSKVRNCKIAVTYTGGLEAATGKIKGAALYQLAYEFQSKEQIGATSFSSEGGTVNRPELDLLKETKRMLKSSIHPLKV